MGGILCALSLVCMLLTILPISEMGLPALAGAVLIPIILEIGVKWGWMSYACVAPVSYTHLDVYKRQIYSLGDPIDYRSMVISLRPGMRKKRDDLLAKLVELQYERNDINFIRNKFRVRGDVVEIFTSGSSETVIRVEFFGDEIDRISEIHPLTGELKGVVNHVAIYPASHYIVPRCV